VLFAGGVAAAAGRGDELVMHHADFHARVGIRLAVRVGEVPPDQTLTATLENDAGTYRRETQWTGPTLLRPETVLPLELRGLPKGDYTLTVRLSDGRRTTRRWSKPYDGDPRVALDENNAIRVNGRLFFPVTPYNASTEEEAARWAPYVNTFFGVGFAPARHTIAGCREFLDLAARHGKYAIAPGRGAYWLRGQNGTRLYPDPENPSGKKLMDRAANPEAIAAYVEALRDHPALLFWDWCDEPDLDNSDNAIPPAEIRRWTEICHRLDPHHPVYVNLTGKFGRPEDNWGFRHVRTYTLYGLELPGPDRVPLVDVYSLDIYPIDGQNDPNYEISFETMMRGLRRLRELNGDLVPVGAFVETCAIRRDSQLPPPTPAELRLMAWANIVAGARMISWFHYFNDTPPENFKEMARFLDQVTRLTPAVCGPPYGGSITLQLQGGGRIDWTANTAVEGDGALYLLAVNLKRAPESATFTLDFEPAKIEVFDENRTLSTAGRAFTDVFEPLAVHIYRIER